MEEFSLSKGTDSRQKLLSYKIHTWRLENKVGRLRRLTTAQRCPKLLPENRQKAECSFSDLKLAPFKTTCKSSTKILFMLLQPQMCSIS